MPIAKRATILRAKLKAEGYPLPYTEAGRQDPVRAGPFPEQGGGRQGGTHPEGARRIRVRGGQALTSVIPERIRLHAAGPDRVVGALLGFWRGLVSEIIALGAWVLAFVTASFVPELQPHAGGSGSRSPLLQGPGRPFW